MFRPTCRAFVNPKWVSDGSFEMCSRSGRDSQSCTCTFAYNNGVKRWLKDFETLHSVARVHLEFIASPIA